jgi:hypothetical protein
MFHSNEWLAMVADMPDGFLPDWFRIGAELVIKEDVQSRRGTAATIHFRRGQLGTTAACHPAETEIIPLHPILDGSTMKVSFMRHEQADALKSQGGNA